MAGGRRGRRDQWQAGAERQERKEINPVRGCILVTRGLAPVETDTPDSTLKGLHVKEGSTDQGQKGRMVDRLNG